MGGLRLFVFGRLLFITLTSRHHYCYNPSRLAGDEALFEVIVFFSARKLVDPAAIIDTCPANKTMDLHSFSLYIPAL